MDDLPYKVISESIHLIVTFLVTMGCLFDFEDFDPTKLIAVNDFARLCIKDESVWPCRNGGLV